MTYQAFPTAMKNFRPPLAILLVPYCILLGCESSNNSPTAKKSSVSPTAKSPPESESVRVDTPPPPPVLRSDPKSQTAKRSKPRSAPKTRKRIAPRSTPPSQSTPPSRLTRQPATKPASRPKSTTPAENHCGARHPSISRSGRSGIRSKLESRSIKLPSCELGFGTTLHHRSAKTH